MPGTKDVRQPDRLILASASPRRQSLLREYGYDFEIVVPEDDEPDAGTMTGSPTERAEVISRHKARSVAAKINTGCVLSGDTIAALGDHVFGKPADRSDAKAILASLMGTTHRVITGVTLLDVESGRCDVRHAVTDITMKALADSEIEAYLDTGEWAGKAGAYGIQDRGDAFVERIEGSFTNVVGFPMEMIASMLARWNIQPRSDSNAPRI